MKKSEHGEATISKSSRKVELKTLNPIGRLEDPSEKKKDDNEYSEEDNYGVMSNPGTYDISHSKDPNFIDISKEEKRMKRWAVDSGKLSKISKSEFTPVIAEDTKRGMLHIYQEALKRYGNNCIVEFADDSFRIRKAKATQGDPVIEFQDVMTGRVDGKQMILETAEDDRVIGIPYTIANIGADKYYVINGRVFSSWSMWFGLQAIRSPEDYARNVDIAYNVSFVWAGFQLKSQLSLGAAFDIVHGSEEEETPEEMFLKNVFFSKLKLGKNKLAKTSFHLDLYGNAYWHIRRDGRGFPDKITILQPERIKVFLDPKTTKVLYYIYLPPVLAGMALTPYPAIRTNPSVMYGPALTYPTPIVIDPQDIIHFKENDFTEYPYGLSSCKAMIDPCTARMDINLLAPMIFKKYAKPMIHWRVDPVAPFQLAKGQIESYIDGMKNTLEHMEPMSDPITTTRWTAQPIGAAQGKAELLTLLQDLDNQVFACIGVPETYFKPQMGNDRMIAEQDKTLMASMEARQMMVGEKVQDQLVKVIIDRYDYYVNMQLQEQGKELLPIRMWNQYPTLQWKETFKQDQVTTIQNTMALLQSGLIDHSRAARRVGENPPQESAELSRQQDLQKITEEVQILQAQLQYMQTQVGIMDAQVTINAGGSIALQSQMMAAAPGGEGDIGKGKGGSGGSASKPNEPAGRAGAKQARDEQMLKVTFMNRAGKRQTENMRSSTLDKLKSGGVSIEKIDTAGISQKQSMTPNQQKAKETLG